MPGMNSGLSPSDPTLVAAFRSVLLTADSGGDVALLLAGNSLLAAWWNGTRWTVSDPVSAGTLRATGFGASGSAWVLLGGGRAEVITGTGAAWRTLPPVPAGTQVLGPAGTTVLAPGSAAYDALAVAGSRLTVWRLAAGAWAKVQVINVPITYGSSG